MVSTLDSREREVSIQSFERKLGLWFRQGNFTVCQCSVVFSRGKALFQLNSSFSSLVIKFY